MEELKKKVADIDKDLAEIDKDLKELNETIEGLSESVAKLNIKVGKTNLETLESNQELVEALKKKKIDLTENPFDFATIFKGLIIIIGIIGSIGIMLWDELRRLLKAFF